jgi:hypothetical protein
MVISNIITATTTQVFTGKAKAVYIQINATPTGNVTVIDGTSGTTSTHGVVTAPTVGMFLRFYKFGSGVRIITTGTPDITVYVDTSHGDIKV